MTTESKARRLNRQINECKGLLEKAPFHQKAGYLNALCDLQCELNENLIEQMELMQNGN